MLRKKWNGREATCYKDIFLFFKEREREGRAVQAFCLSASGSFSREKLPGPPLCMSARAGAGARRAPSSCFWGLVWAREGVARGGRGPRGEDRLGACRAAPATPADAFPSRCLGSTAGRREPAPRLRCSFSFRTRSCRALK